MWHSSCCIFKRPRGSCGCVQHAPHAKEIPYPCGNGVQYPRTPPLQKGNATPQSKEGCCTPHIKGGTKSPCRKGCDTPRGCNIPSQKEMRHPLGGRNTPTQGIDYPFGKRDAVLPLLGGAIPHPRRRDTINQPLWQGMRCLPRMGKQYLLTLEDTIACAAWWGQWGGVPEHPSANRNPPCDTRALRHEKSNWDGVENHPRTNDASIMQVNALCSTGTHATSHRRRRIHAANRVAKLPATQGT